MHPLIHRLEQTFHRTGQLDMDAIYGIQHLLTGQRVPNPCNELMFRQPHLVEKNK